MENNLHVLYKYHTFAIYDTKIDVFHEYILLKFDGIFVVFFFNSMI